MAIKWTISQIPECTSSISHNALFRTEMWTFLFWIEHCGIWNRCILRFVNSVNWQMLLAVRIADLSINVLHWIWLNTLRSSQNGHHFADDIFKWIFLNENARIPIKILLKFVPQGPINNIPALVQKMAWRRPGDKPLSGPMMVRLPTHICVTRPQWVKLQCSMGWCNRRGFLPLSKCHWPPPPPIPHGQFKWDVICLPFRDVQGGCERVYLVLMHYFCGFYSDVTWSPRYFKSTRVFVQ